MTETRPADSPDVQRAMMARDILELRDDIAALRGDVKDLIAAWKGANAALVVVKWIGALVGAASGTWLAVSSFLHLGHPK